MVRASASVETPATRQPQTTKRSAPTRAGGLHRLPRLPAIRRRQPVARIQRQQQSAIQKHQFCAKQPAGDWRAAGAIPVWLAKPREAEIGRETLRRGDGRLVAGE